MPRSSRSARVTLENCDADGNRLFCRYLDNVDLRMKNRGVSAKGREQNIRLLTDQMNQEIDESVDSVATAADVKRILKEKFSDPSEWGPRWRLPREVLQWIRTRGQTLALVGLALAVVVAVMVFLPREQTSARNLPWVELSSNASFDVEPLEGLTVSKGLDGGGQYRAMVFSPDDRRLLTASGDWTERGDVQLLDLVTATAVTAYEEKLGIPCVALSPDGQQVAYTTWSENTLRLRAVEGGKVIFSKSFDAIPRVAFSPDGKMLAAATEAGLVQCLDSSGKFLDIFPADEMAYRCIAFSPDGKSLIVGGGHWDDFGRIFVWDAKSRRRVRELAEHRRAVLSVAVSPDSNTLAAGDVEGAVRVWDLQTGSCIRAIPHAHESVIEGVAFSPDGKLVASASWDSTVKVWEPATGRCFATLHGHVDRVQGVAFSHSGKMIATCGRDKIIRFYQIRPRGQATPAGGQ